MRFFDRLSRLIRANANAALSSVEDPGKILDQSVADMQSDLVKLRQAVATAIASQKRIANQAEQAESQSATWYERAELALKKGEEDLAKEALARRRTCQETSTALSNQLNSQAGQVELLKKSLLALEGKIAETQRRLEDSEEDREFLLVELKRLQTEKAELEREFNDMALLREQVRRLRDEMSISRRLDWIRHGLYGSFRKGGELLQQGFSAKPADTNYNLNVELGVDGSVKLTQPSTNAAPSDPVPADQ